jgi:hypothetical protein
VSTVTLFAPQAAGASSARHSLRPLLIGRDLNIKPRAKHAARSRTHILPSLRAKRSNPFFLACRYRLLRFAALAMTVQHVVPAFEPGPIITGSGVVRRSSNTVYQTIDYAVWVPAFAGTTFGLDHRPHTVPSTITSINFAPGRPQADASADFNSLGSAMRVASSPIDLARPTKSTLGSIKSIPT